MTKTQKIILIGSLGLILILIFIAIIIVLQLNKAQIDKNNFESETNNANNSENVTPLPIEDKPKKVSLTFSPGITSNCRKKTAPQPKWFEETEGDCTNAGSYGPWIFSTTVENDLFTGGTVADWGKIGGYSYSFVPTLENPSKYEINFKLDKINFEQNVDKNNYTAYGFNDWYLKQPITLDQDIYLSFKIKINEFTTLKTTDKNRIFLAFGAEDSDGRRYFLELNLIKTTNFDLCTDINLGGDGVDLPCDVKGFLDRRSANDFYKYDIVYYDYNGMAQSFEFSNLFSNYTPIELSSYNEIVIPISKVFKSADWVKKQEQSKITLLGTYILTEIYGEGASSITIKDYDLYKVL